MADFITLSCPSCGNKLQITPDIDRFACAACGNEHIVRRSGGIISLAPVVEGLQQIRTGVDKAAAELAIARLRDEIKELGAVDFTEAINLISFYPSRRAYFMRVYAKFKGIKRSAWDSFWGGSQQECQKILSNLAVTELEKLTSYFSKPQPDDDDKVIKSCLDTLTKKYLQDEKQRQLERYKQIVNQ